MNQFIVNTIAEKVASLKTLNYLVQTGSKEHALSILKRASTHKPNLEDTL